MQVGGILKVGEASRTAAAVAARQRGSQAWLWVAMFGLMALFGGGGWLLTPRSSALPPSTAMLVGFGVAWSIYIVFVRRVMVYVFRRRFVARGLGTELALTFTLDPERLIYEIGDLTQTAKWRAVTDLFRSGDYWIVLAQGSAFFAPMRFFKTVDEERAFISEALSHMSPDARSRSDAAVAFAQSIKPG